MKKKKHEHHWDIKGTISLTIGAAQLLQCKECMEVRLERP